MTINVGTHAADTTSGVASRIEVANERLKGMVEKISVTFWILKSIKNLLKDLVKKDKSILFEPLVQDLQDYIKNCGTAFESVREDICDLLEATLAPSRIRHQKREKVRLRQDILSELSGILDAAELKMQDYKLNLQLQLFMIQMNLSNK